MGEPLNDRGFTNTWFSDQHRVVLSFTRKDPNNATNLTITSDHRIKFSFTRFLHQVTAVPLQRLVGLLRISARDALISSHNIEGGEKSIPGEVESRADTSKRALRVALKRGEHEMLYGDVLIFETLRLLLRLHEELPQLGREIDLSRFNTGTRNLRSLVELLINLSEKRLNGQLHLFEEPRYESVMLLEQTHHKMLNINLRIATTNSLRLRVLKRFLRFLSESI